MIGRRAVPIPFVRRRVHGVAGPHDEDVPAAGLDQADTVGHVQGPTAGVGVTNQAVRAHGAKRTVLTT